MPVADPRSPERILSDRMKGDDPEDRKAAAREMRARLDAKKEEERQGTLLSSTDQGVEANLYDQLLKLRPRAIRILEQGLKVPDVKVKHESMKLVIKLLDDMNPDKNGDEPTVVRYETAALPPPRWKPELDDFTPAPLA